MRYFSLGLNFAAALFSLWVHDLACVWVSGRLGDPDAASRQRSPVNPFARVDWIGSVLLPLFLLFRGLPVLGWTRPLVLQRHNLRRPGRAELLVAVAGPAANLLLALAGIGLAWGLQRVIPQLLFPTLVFFCLTNACLAVFSLLPIPPLAGSAAAELCLRDESLAAFEDIKPFGFLLILAGAYFNFFDFLTIPLTRLVMSLIGA